MLIELTTFRLREGEDAVVDSFLAADAAVQTGFHCLQPGMLRRTTARGDDGEWLVMILWGSAEQADAAIDAGRSSSEVEAFAAHVDTGSVQVRRYSPLAG